MKTYNDQQAKNCPIAKSWGERHSPNTPYCDDCFVTNEDEPLWCSEAVFDFLVDKNQNNND